MSGLENPLPDTTALRWLGGVRHGWSATVFHLRNP